MERNKMAIAIGAMLLMVNIGMAATGFVDGLIEGAVADQIAESYDEQSDFDEEWHVSTAERVYFANSITDQSALESDNPADAFTMMGPFIYEVTTTREILEFDSEGGSMTYSEYDVFEWCDDCTWTDDEGTKHESASGDTNITNVNILWNTQRIGGMGGATGGVFYGETFAKAMFAAGMVEFDLANRAPSIWASEEIDLMVPGASAALQQAGYDEATAHAMAPAVVLRGAYDNWLAQSGASDANPDFAASAQSILYDAVDPSTGVCIAITCDLGPVLVAGMGEPSETTTPARAALFGYGSTDPAVLAHMDWAVYALAGTTFATNGGGAEINNQTPLLKERFHEVSGIMINTPETLDNLLFNPNVGMMGSFELSGIPLPGMVIGLLLPLQSGNYYDAMITYNLGLLTISDLADYVEPWVGLGVTGAPRDFEQILMGGEGTINSEQWWHTAFGSADPLTGEYISIGLNREQFAGMADLSAEKSNFILTDPDIGLKSSFPAAFMYGELSGMSLPDWEGNQHVWDDAYVGALYGISDDAAHALRDWVYNFYFDTVMPVLMNFVTISADNPTGNSPYTTQPVSNWLYGWSDDVNTNFGFFPWVSLETNETYYGSGGISTGDRSVYQMSISGDNIGQRLAQGYINSDGDGACDYDYDTDGEFIGYELPCEANQTYGMTVHLPWRAPHREDAALGLLSDHVGNPETVVAGTAGSIADADASFDYNLIGYSIGHSVVGEETTYKGIAMTDHSIVLDPAQNQIQGKLIGSDTFVDAMPGALPIYFGANIDMKVEPITNAIMYGKVEAKFYLDLRGPGSMNPNFESTDVIPVFEIHVFSDIPDDGAESFRGSVSDNLGPMGWTNFGGDAGAPLSYVTYAIALFYVAGIGLLTYGVRGASGSKDDEE